MSDDDVELTAEEAADFAEASKLADDLQQVLAGHRNSAAMFALAQTMARHIRSIDPMARNFGMHRYFAMVADFVSGGEDEETMQ